MRKQILFIQILRRHNTKRYSNLLCPIMSWYGFSGATELTRTQGNALFHADSSFNPRRASFSLLRAHALPPPGNGGDTGFADSRTAFGELPLPFKSELLENGYTAAHCMAHSRKTAAPDFFRSVDVEAQPMHSHKVIQLHEPSNRMKIYVAAHTSHSGCIEARFGIDTERAPRACHEPKYRVSAPWPSVGDLIIWDNTCVLHRTGPETSAGKYKRDLRRTTVRDTSSSAWGLNDIIDKWGCQDSKSGHKRQCC
jgi:alpha-ketoglutarate-dependent 2,4-dichlorophenoxyacetate dioxygenase